GDHLGLIRSPADLPLHQSYPVLSPWVSSLVGASAERPAGKAPVVKVSKKPVFPQDRRNRRPLVVRGPAARWGSAQRGPWRAPPAAPDGPSSSRARPSPDAAQPAKHTPTESLVNRGNLCADELTGVLGGSSSALGSNGRVEEEERFLRKGTMVVQKWCLISKKQLFFNV
uniref:Uncharacterized protein n=1 Tax=Tetraodon nigroviridis TaxID=99883 RepID=H3C5D9_TETNG